MFLISKLFLIIDRCILHVIPNNHIISIISGKLESCLLTTGVLWEFCDRFPTLPKNNIEAVATSLSKEENLIKDAIDELEQV